ncbi:MAG: SGNH/GDSL hydrolase family protein [Burkholderiales bacterium]|nr:SGNH/GDSL hydrolase family protein [Burkholderiales bacterium]
MRFSSTLASIGTVAVLLASPFSSAQAAYSQIIAFGDSLSDNGNLFSRTQPALGAGIPAAPYFNGRFSNGPVAVEVMAQTLGVSLVDYAYGGALTGVSNRIPLPGLLDNTGLQGQVNAFTGGLASQGKTADASALYFLWGGGNDFFSSTNPVATAGTVIANLTSELGQLYGSGAREFFVPLLPDMSYSAEVIAAGATAQAQAHQFSLGFNGALSNALVATQGALAGSNIHIFDVGSVLAQVRSDLTAQGGNVTTGCWSGNYFGTNGGTLCSDSTKYFLWDNVHPTAGVHDAVGHAMAAAVPEPETTGLALVGLMLVGVVVSRRRV